MKRSALRIYILLAGLLFSCQRPVSSGKEENKDGAIAHERSATESQALLKARCYVCHMPDSPSHDSIIAPPMAAVKQRYLMRYPDKEEFVRAIVAWGKDPRADKSIMPGAVDRYQVMPKQDFNTEELTQIASYMYANELEQPEWFADHEKEMMNFGRMGMGRRQMN